jgi:hypothetical protein
MQPRSAALPNPSVKRSANIASGWAASTGACGPFCACCPARHAVGYRLPQTLGSTFKHCGLQASQFKCSFRQSLVQNRSRCLLFVAVAKVVAKPTTRTATNAALTSFGVRESRRLFAPSPNTERTCCWPFTSHHTQARAPGPSGRFSRRRIAKLPAKRVVVSFRAQLLCAARAGRLSGRVRPNSGGSRSRFPYSCAMSPRSAVLPNPSVKRSANIASHWPSSAGPAAHFALAVQRATLLATAYR